MVSTVPILLIGATGYIGGSVLSRLLSHPRAKTFDITVLVRSAEKAKLFELFGVTTVIGSLSDLHTLELLAERSHIVIQSASNNDILAISAIVAGFTKRRAASGDMPILIQTSGTGVLIDSSEGNYVTDTIYYDTNIAQIESLRPTAPHRVVDLFIVESDEAGTLRSYIISPPLIYGIATGPLVDANIQHPHSSQIPHLIRAALDRKQGGTVGLGKSVWSNVHIDEVADLYVVLLNRILESPDAAAHGREGYYFAENGEQSWGDIARGISEALVELGLGTSKEASLFTTEELVKYWGAEFLGLSSGANSRSRAERSRALGWQPTKTTSDLLASIKADVEAVVVALRTNPK